ncbi:MAG: SpoIIE family protein phosphatase [Fibrella sp.]|nr:SpoIIE family protein phosphatase [Armatimonadota bacterium]
MKQIGLPLVASDREVVRVLVVDDDPEDFMITSHLLESIQGNILYSARWVATAEAALAEMPGEFSPPSHDLCLMDFRLGSEDGLEVLQAARAAGYNRPVILLTGHDDLVLDQTAQEYGASDYLVKGKITPSLMERTLRYARAQWVTETALRETNDALCRIRRRENEVGAAIQQKLLVAPITSATPIAGLRVGARSIGTEKIDGDFYDFFAFGTRSLDVVVGDVMGKGTAAALLGAAVKSHLGRVQRDLLISLRPYNRLPEPAEIVNGLHALVAEELCQLQSFVTLDYARFDLAEQVLRLVDCGHPPPLCYSPDGKIRTIAGDDMPLGMCVMDFVPHYEEIFPLRGGEVFVFYSDGVTDAEDSRGQPFGDERLSALVAELAPRCSSPQEIADSICNTVNEYQGATIGDDITVVVVAIDPNAGKPKTPTTAAARQLRVCEFPAKPEALEDVRSATETACRELCGEYLDEETIDQIIIAVNEAAANIIEHSLLRNANSRFQWEADFLNTSLRFRLRDTGRRFSPDCVPPPVFDGSEDGGFGLFIISAVFDSVVYDRDPLGRNTLHMSIALIELKKG